MNNVQPRVGFAWQLDDRTIVRGGSGLYFAIPLSVETFWRAQAARLAVIQYSNNGRPDFAANPTNGQPLPTLPIWLKESWAISLDLEASYEESCRTLRIR